MLFSRRGRILLLMTGLLLAAGTARAAGRDATGSCHDGDPVLSVLPRRGEGYIHLARRWAAREDHWREIRAANDGRNVQTGRRVRIPLALLPQDRRADVLRDLFPGDRYADGGWRHRVGGEPGKACREDRERIATWFTGNAGYAADLGRLNGIGTGRLAAGTEVFIPRAMLWEAFVPADLPPQAELTYGEDETGPYAEYRLGPGEALYSSVVVRFTGRLDAEEVNQLAAAIAERSGIRDVRDIPIGFPVKIPFDLLLPAHLPADHPDRIAWEQERSEAARYRVQATARRLQGVHVILDAGHGGVDVGTTNGGMDEDEYVYDVLCRIKRLLDHTTDAMTLTTIEDRITGYEVRDVEKLPRDRNELIRTTPPYAPEDPNRRAVGVNLRWYLSNSYFRRLRDRGIDPQKMLFVSLHADSLHPSLDGVMVYIPGEKYRTGRYGSERSPYVDFEEVREQAYVSFDRSQRLRSEGMSRQFAEKLIATYQDIGVPVHRYQPVRDRVIRRKRSWVPAVIRCSEVPVSVLVELVNLNNPTDRKRMRDPAFREKLATGFVEALLAFYEGDQPAVTARTVGPAP